MTPDQAAQVKEWRPGHWQTGHSGVRPLPLDALTGNTKLFDGRCSLVGWSIYNGSGGTALFEIYDGQDAKGTPTGIISLATLTSETRELGLGGIDMVIGIFLTVPASPIKGSLFVRAFDDPRH